MKIIHRRRLTWECVATCPTCKTVFQVEDGDRPNGSKVRNLMPYALSVDTSPKDYFSCPSCGADVFIDGRSIEAKGQTR